MSREHDLTSVHSSDLSGYDSYESASEYSSDDSPPPDRIAPHFGVFLLNNQHEIEQSAAVGAAVFNIDPVNQLISDFIGYSDESTGDEASEESPADSQNFDPHERYMGDSSFYERHGRFRDSDDDSNEVFFWSVDFDSGVNDSTR